MELFRDILVKALEKNNQSLVVSRLEISAAEIVGLECYNALKRIQSVIENAGLSDNDRVARIKEIICTFSRTDCTSVAAIAPVENMVE